MSYDVIRTVVTCTGYFQPKSEIDVIRSYRLSDNSVHFPFCVVISTIYIYIYIYSKKFEIVFSLNFKDNKRFPCLHNIRLSYSI